MGGGLARVAVCDVIAPRLCSSGRGSRLRGEGAWSAEGVGRGRAEAPPLPGLAVERLGGAWARPRHGGGGRREPGIVAE